MERKLALQLLRENDPTDAQLGRAFNEGWMAAKNREGLASNPYKGYSHPLGMSWVDGYWDFRETRI